MRETRLQQELPRVPMAKQGRVKQQVCGSSACWEPSQEESIEAQDLCLNRGAYVDLLSLNTSPSRQLCKLTTNWKAVCGKTARTVWREGRGFHASFLPLSGTGPLVNAGILLVSAFDSLRHGPLPLICLPHMFPAIICKHRPVTSKNHL